MRREREDDARSRARAWRPSTKRARRGVEVQPSRARASRTGAPRSSDEPRAGPRPSAAAGTARRRRRRASVKAPSSRPRQEEVEALEPQELGRPRREERAELRPLELRHDGAAHVEERALEVGAVAEEHAVHDALHAPAQRIEEEDDDEAEAERERGRREERRRRDRRHERVARDDAERVEARHDGRQDRVDERLADDDLHVEEPEPHDRVRERERDERHRDDAPREISGPRGRATGRRPRRRRTARCPRPCRGGGRGSGRRAARSSLVHHVCASARSPRMR